MEKARQSKAEREIVGLLEELGFVEVGGQEIDPELVDLLAGLGALRSPIRLFIDPRFGDLTGSDAAEIVKINPAGSVQDECSNLGNKHRWQRSYALEGRSRVVGARLLSCLPLVPGLLKSASVNQTAFSLLLAVK